jgi:TRAP-type C4-dicarboxylate transport system substrate-binding protein
MKEWTERIEELTDGQIKFNAFYSGSLCKTGQEYQCLTGGSIDAATTLTAPYHAGMFPLTDVVLLPVLNTDPMVIARAFKKLHYSDQPLKDGKTFYELEIESRDIVAWPVGPTDAYVISTSGKKKFNSPEDFKGATIRCGSRLHSVFIEALGANSTFMVGVDTYEAFSRGAIDGIIFSIPDWKAYGFQEIIRYTLTGISLGHYPSYFAIRKETWDSFSDDVKEAFNAASDELLVLNAQCWINNGVSTIKESKEKHGAVFQDVNEMGDELQQHIYDAVVKTWKNWIEEEEEKGNPARATAKLWAKLVIEEGGDIPQEVKQYLELD